VGPWYSDGQQRNARIGEIVPLWQTLFPVKAEQTRHLRAWRK